MDRSSGLSGPDFGVFLTIVRWPGFIIRIEEGRPYPFLRGAALFVSARIVLGELNGKT